LWIGIHRTLYSACIAGSRIYVQEGIYDEFLAKLTAAAKARTLGDPFSPETVQGPQISQVQLDVSLYYRSSLTTNDH
jgi:aldehyde dehydrogenase (NAD+)